jgi:hypothetical protein
MKLVTITKPCEINMGRSQIKFPVPGAYWVTEAWLEKLRAAEAVEESE